MKTLKTIIIALIISGTSLMATDWTTNLSYNISFPSGNIDDYIRRVSWLGFSMDFKAQEKSNMTWGFSFAWNSFYYKTGETVTFDLNENTGAALSGTQLRYLNAFPMLLNLGYVFGKQYSEIKPFVTAYLGTTYFSRQVDVGLYRLTNYAWGFTAAPEIGIKIPTDRKNNFTLSARWYNSWGVEDSFIGNETYRNYFTLNIGFDMSY